MALTDLKLLRRLETLAIYSHKTVALFPKSERHVLAADIRATHERLIKLTITAAKRYYKKTTLQDMDVELEYLRVQIRAAYSLKYIDEHKYMVWAQHADQVGELLGGWLKVVRDTKEGNKSGL